MPLDRFVYWKKETPSDEEIQKVLEDYMGGAGEIVNRPQKNGKPWFFVSLPGTGTFPFKRCKIFVKGAALPQPTSERWFEVYVGDDHIDVMTRHSDEFTGVVADGFAELMKRFYEGRLER